jgi:hypothetical protein
MREPVDKNGENMESINTAEVDGVLFRVGKELSELVLQLVEESERSAVIIGVARLELALENFLKHVMRQPTGGEDNLFAPEKPLSSFASKISLAHRLGLINDEFEHALQMIRKMRNDFAHSIEDENLSNQRHANRMRGVLKAVKTSQLWNVIWIAFKDIDASIDLRGFAASLVVLIGELEVATSVNEKCKSHFVKDSSFFCKPFIERLPPEDIDSHKTNG